MNISVVGKVSVGKSSFINTFHYLINERFGISQWQPITTIAIKRETFHPVSLIFGFKQDSYSYEEEIKANANIRKEPAKLDSIDFIERHIMPENGKIRKIIDFPGFDDSNDKRDCLGAILENMGDITIFVTDASRAFIDQSECDYFNRIRDRSKELNEKGIKNKLIIVVNKFDHINQMELNEIFNELPTDIMKFKWCSYAALKKTILANSEFAKLVTAPCDIDKFMDYIFASETQISVLDFIPHDYLIKIGKIHKIGSLRLIYKFMETADLEKELAILTKPEIVIIAKGLLIPAGDKELMIKKIASIEGHNDSYIDIFYNLPALEEKALKEKLNITFSLFEYYKFFGLNAIENWTVPYLQVLAKSLNIKGINKKKQELLDAIMRVAKPGN